MAEQKGGEHPVIPLPAIGHADDAIAQRVDFGSKRENFIPCRWHMVRIAARFTDKISVIIHDRVWGCESQTHLLAVELGQLQEAIGKTFIGEIAISFDEGRKIGADIALSQDAQTVEADKADIRHFRRACLTQH